MQISAATTQKGQAFEGKGVGAHKFKPHCFSPNAVPFSPNSKQPVIPFAKPSLKGLTGQAPINKTPQFPPTPSTIIKPPRFYSNQSLIIPRSKPNLGNVVNVVSDSDKECICEREDGIVICQRLVKNFTKRKQSLVEYFF
jgi:hypothetical protein